ncbi:MAG: SDR family NAD(P)-dependent oxidoreductase [Candidatus Methanomethylophilaceae archaeon]
MQGYRDLAGRHVVVTGANSGIGACLLKGFLEQGCTVVAADIRDSEIAGMASDRVHPVICDLSVKEGVDRLFSEAEAFMGTIDIFVANAGFPYYEVIDRPDWDHIERIFGVNTLSPIYSYEKMLEHLAGRRGMFVLTDSAMGETSMPGFALYSATKFAMNGFSTAVDFEMPDNISFVTVYPVSTDTGFFRNDTTSDMDKPFPVQTPEHVAKDIINGIRRGRRRVYPSRMYSVFRAVFILLPPVRYLYRRYYARKLMHNR